VYSGLALKEVRITTRALFGKLVPVTSLLSHFVLILAMVLVVALSGWVSWAAWSGLLASNTRDCWLDC
jgi:nitrogen fixation protein FixH